jgi:hypothetical protein
MSDRLDYLETEGHYPKPETEDGQDQDFHYPVLAQYDFTGRGPRPGAKFDESLYRNAMALETRGERVGRVLRPVLFILVNLIIGVVVMYIAFHSGCQPFIEVPVR